MSLTWLKVIADIAAMIAFFAICYWAFNPKNRVRFEEDAKMVLDDDPILSKSKTDKPIDSRENP